MEMKKISLVITAADPYYNESMGQKWFDAEKLTPPKELFFLSFSIFTAASYVIPKRYGLVDLLACCALFIANIMPFPLHRFISTSDFHIERAIRTRLASTRKLIAPRMSLTRHCTFIAVLNAIPP